MGYLVYQCNNTCHHSIGEKPIHADYFALTEEFESTHKAYKIKVDDRIYLTS